MEVVRIIDSESNRKDEEAACTRERLPSGYALREAVQRSTIAVQT